MGDMCPWDKSEVNAFCMKRVEIIRRATLLISNVASLTVLRKAVGDLDLIYIWSHRWFVDFEDSVFVLDDVIRSRRDFEVEGLFLRRWRHRDF